MSGLTKQGPKDSSRAEENKHTQDTYAGKYVFLMKYVPTHTVSIFYVCSHTYLYTHPTTRSIVTATIALPRFGYAPFPSARGRWRRLAREYPNEVISISNVLHVLWQQASGIHGVCWGSSRWQQPEPSVGATEIELGKLRAQAGQPRRDEAEAWPKLDLESRKPILPPLYTCSLRLRGDMLSTARQPQSKLRG